MSERYENYTIMEGHSLPSKGKIYDCPVNPNVELRSMTARDEMKRLAPSNSQFKVLADIIEGCLIEKPAVSVYDMALGDYEFLLHRLRVVTYGSDYKMMIACPHCGKTFEGMVNLDQIQVKEFDQEAFENLQTFTLPVSNDIVRIRFQTPRMLDEIEARTKEMKRKYRSAAIEFNLQVLLEAVIDEVNGNKLDPAKREQYINTLAAKDMRKIVNNLDALNACIGIDSTVYSDCTECGGEVTTFFRFGPEFFRPTTI